MEINENKKHEEDMKKTITVAKMMEMYKEMERIQDENINGNGYEQSVAQGIGTSMSIMEDCFDEMGVKWW